MIRMTSSSIGRVYQTEGFWLPKKGTVCVVLVASEGRVTKMPFFHFFGKWSFKKNLASVPAMHTLIHVFMPSYVKMVQGKKPKWCVYTGRIIWTLWVMLVGGSRTRATGAIPLKIQKGHSFLTCHPSPKFRPNRSSFREDKVKNVFQDHYNTGQQLVSCRLLTQNHESKREISIMYSYENNKIM